MLPEEWESQSNKSKACRLAACCHSAKRRPRVIVDEFSLVSFWISDWYLKKFCGVLCKRERWSVFLPAALLIHFCDENRMNWHQINKKLWHNPPFPSIQLCCCCWNLTFYLMILIEYNSSTKGIFCCVLMKK